MSWPTVPEVLAHGILVVDQLDGCYFIHAERGEVKIHPRTRPNVLKAIKGWHRTELPWSVMWEKPKSGNDTEAR